MQRDQEASVAATFARLRDHWERTDAGARPGVSAEALRAFEATHGVQMPRAMAAFYRAMDGMRSDEHLLVAWPLKEVGRVPETVATVRGVPDFGPITRTLPNASEYFAFADSMCWSHVYATRLTAAGEDSPVLWICGREYKVLAPDFRSFWERYLDDGEAVVWAGTVD